MIPKTSFILIAKYSIAKLRHKKYAEFMSWAKCSLRKGVSYDERTGDIQSCLFCKIISRREPGSIVYESPDIVAFKTMSPTTEKHLLVVPRRHIRNVKSLSGPQDAELVKQLMRVEMQCLGNDAANARYYFNTPPWNSVDHLHLHAIGKPETMNLLGRLFYSRESFWCKSAQSIIERLSSENNTEGEELNVENRRQ
jgi:diadenosine tetraphosphate (Ap4A) HIT family hydrolase